MSALTRPRGPHPARVYWVRRILVLSVALVCVVGLARLLGAAGDGSTAGGQATQASADRAGADRASANRAEAPPPSSTEPTSDGQPDPAQPTGADASDTSGTTEETTGEDDPAALAQPDGTCLDSDVVASPVVYRAVAGRRSLIWLELTTRETPACRWQASSETITVKISDRTGEEFWTSRQCPQTVPRRNLVLRRDHGVKIGVYWSGRRSDPVCGVDTQWALPGWYRVQSAALAGEPRELQFQLRRPVEVVTRSPVPAREARPTDQPTGDPSGAVEPEG